ncbi:hypothetical protein GGS20DRAFT_274869 [Poronia punctata]|nr:hypothetical protein GGS20DRAFT_274869 [Poronia punctata]
MIWIIAAVASLLAAEVYGAPGRIVERRRGSDGVSSERNMGESAYESLAKRQLNNVGANNNATQWESDTLGACMTALSVLPTASNPSGMAICYNLAQLDTNLGTFMADLRLFQVSPPSGAFEGIPPQQMKAGLAFNGATASKVRGQEVKVRETIDSSLGRRQNPGPAFLRTYEIIGRINNDQMKAPMTIDKIEPLVMPIFTLTATNAAGKAVSTNVSSTEAVFVIGIFSKDPPVLSASSTASLAMQNATERLKAGEVAFVLPGLNILIFPIGLVITGIWTIIGVGFYAFGTYERYQYRESYRRRMAMTASKSYAPRI